MLKHLSLFFAALVTSAIADHDPAADVSWHVLSAGGDESRLSVYQQDQLFGIFNLECDLTDIAEGQSEGGDASLSLVKTEASPDGLLVISCNVGAHSRQVSIIDLATRSNQAAFSVTGSYFARWELQDGEFWIGYDEPCETGPSVECPDGFVTNFVQYPDSGNQSVD